MQKKKFGCGARGITNFKNPLVMKLTKKVHSHPIEKKNFATIPIASLFKPE